MGETKSRVFDCLYFDSSEDAIRSKPVNIGIYYSDRDAPKLWGEIEKCALENSPELGKGVERVETHFENYLYDILMNYGSRICERCPSCDRCGMLFIDRHIHTRLSATSHSYFGRN